MDGQQSDASPVVTVGEVTYLRILVVDTFAPVIGNLSIHTLINNGTRCMAARSRSALKNSAFSWTIRCVFLAGHDHTLCFLSWS